MPVENKPSKENAVLIVRVNNRSDIWATDDSLKVVRDRFPGKPIYTLVFSEADAALSDPDCSRFDRVIVYPSDSQEFRPKDIFALAALLRENQIGTTVVCLGGVAHTDYSRQICAALAFPCRKYLIGTDLRLIHYMSPSAIWTVGRSIVFAALWPLRITAYKLAKIRRRKVERATGGRRLSQTELKSLQKILCLRLDHIGDLMMTFPAIAALRALYPNARIDLVTQTANRPLLSCVDYIDNVFYYNAPFFHRSSSRPSSFFEWLKLAIEIRRRRYDIAFDFRGDSDARKLAFASGAKFRLGQHPSPLHLDEPGNWAFALTHSCNPHPDTHMSDSCLDLLTNAGIDVSWPESYFAVCNDHVSKAAAYLTGSQIIGPYAVVHMLSVEEIRNWIPQRMVDVINHLTMAHGLSVILTGAEGQREQIQSVMNIVNNKESVRNAAGELTLDMLPAILAQARIMVTIDTGPMHIAAALKVPVVALMLPINARLHFPHGQRERIVVAGTAPVDLVRSDKNALLPLASVSSGDVIRAVDEVLLSISSHLGAEPPSIQWPQTKAHDIINRK